MVVFSHLSLQPLLPCTRNQQCFTTATIPSGSAILNTSSNDEISNVDLTETNTEKDTSDDLQIKYCSHNCKYENGDESHDTMLTCDMCDRWYHLTCIDITEEMAKE